MSLFGAQLFQTRIQLQSDATDKSLKDAAETRGLKYLELLLLLKDVKQKNYVYAWLLRGESSVLIGNLLLAELRPLSRE